jgi:hypothetical protein
MPPNGSGARLAGGDGAVANGSLAEKGLAVATD